MRIGVWLMFGLDVVRRSGKFWVFNQNKRKGKRAKELTQDLGWERRRQFISIKESAIKGVPRLEKDNGM